MSNCMSHLMQIICLTWEQGQALYVYMYKGWFASARFALDCKMDRSRVCKSIRYQDLWNTTFFWSWFQVSYSCHKKDIVESWHDTYIEKITGNSWSCPFISRVGAGITRLTSIQTRWQPIWESAKHLWGVIQQNEYRYSFKNIKKRKVFSQTYNSSQSLIHHLNGLVHSQSNWPWQKLQC